MCSDSVLHIADSFISFVFKYLLVKFPLNNIQPLIHKLDFVSTAI